MRIVDKLYRLHALWRLQADNIGIEGSAKKLYTKAKVWKKLGENVEGTK